MVGGKVVEVIRLAEKVWVNTQEYIWYPPDGRFYPRDMCAIYVRRNDDAEQIAPGDSLWWQGGEAYWTPQTREFADRPIPRVGYSGVPRPWEGREDT